MLFSVLSASIFTDGTMLVLSLLVFIALMMTKVGHRFGIPTLLLFLLVGMMAGNDIIGLKFDNYESAEIIGELAMCVIILSGALETDMKKVRPVMKQGILLSTVGVLVTVALTAFFLFLTFGRNGSSPVSVALAKSVLVASVMASTDSASVFSLLRSKRLRLKENIGSVLEMESGSNDPLAHLLTIIMVGVVAALQGASSGPVKSGSLIASAAFELVMKIIIGAAIGYAVGKGSTLIFKKIRLGGSPLYAILILTMGFFSYGLSSMLWGSGLLAIYVTGLIIGNDVNMPFRKDVQKVMDGITWLAQLLMFLMLGLLASPGRLPSVSVSAICVALFMMFVARPISVFICLSRVKSLSFRGKLFVSWVGLKGAGPIMFAVAPVAAGLANATRIFDIVFVVTLLSLIIQGMTLAPVAKLLKVSLDEAPPVDTLGIDIPEELGDITNYTLKESDLKRGNTLSDLHLPHGTRVIMLKRGEYYLAPHGSLALKPGDMMVILVSEHTEDNIPEELL